MTSTTRPNTVGVAPLVRVGWVDGARGLSIVAMVVSHVGLLSGVTPQWFHLYVMRPVAPMFLLLLGMLWRPGFRRRHVQFIAAACASQALALYLGLAFPNILVVMGLVLCVMPWAVRYPVAVVGLAVTSLAFWPVGDWWTGYPLGYALVLVLVGHLLPADGFVRGYGRVGVALGLEAVGRRPMTWYVGHLVVLAAVAGL